MRCLFVFLLLFVCHGLQAVAAPSRVDSALDSLDRILAQREIYFTRHISRIDSLKYVSKQIPAANLKARSSALHDIFKQYAAFQSDSALKFARRQLQLAVESGDYNDILRARTDMILINVSDGNFSEALDMAAHTDLSQANARQKVAFYANCIRLYADLAAYTSNATAPQYMEKSMQYCDSVLAFGDPDSFEYQFAKATRDAADSPQLRLELLKKLAAREDVDLGKKAMVTSIIADAFRSLNQPDSVIYYKAHAAILDVLASKRETISKLDLAKLLYELDDIERAYRYMDLAREDANYFNSRNRKVQLMDILPTLEQARYLNLESRRKALIVSNIIIAALALLLMAAIVIIFRQLKRTRELREQTEVQNELLKKEGKVMSDTIDRLVESNSIKDRYIGREFSIHADYIRKMESLYNMIDRKLMAKQYDELHKSIKRSDIREDKESMLARFDGIFLDLFPDFIERWNGLFPEGQAKSPETKERALTPEMRIFAMIRLGISEISDISLFLGYSVNTINTYKTKAKNRSNVANDRFEATIMEFPSR